MLTRTTHGKGEKQERLVLGHEEDMRKTGKARHPETKVGDPA